MTTERSENEAAERLRTYINAQGMDRAITTYHDAALGDLDAALAAERRATVERIREAIKGRGFSPISEADQEWIGWRLDEEAAR